MQIRRLILGLFGLVLMLGVGQSTAAVQAQSDKPAPYKLYVGQVTDRADAFVALAIRGEDATLYVCDGQADKNTVSVADWFNGKVKDNTIDITAPDGNRVVLKITDSAADGQFTLTTNTVQQFSLKLDPAAALYRSEFTIDEAHYVGGWIVFADGSFRGSVNRKTPAFAAPADLSIVTEGSVATVR